MRTLALLLLLSGCFVHVGASYSPSTTISVQRESDPMPVEHREASATINLRVGVYLDLVGIGVHHAWYAARVLRSASGLPRQPNVSGTHTRFDADLPVRFGPRKMFGLRASYAYETFDSFNAAKEVNLAAHGSGHHGGLTMTMFHKDLSLGFLVGKYDVQSDNDPSDAGTGKWPRFGTSGWDLDVGFMLRFIPTGFLISHFVASKSESPDVGRTTPRCGYRAATDGGGYVCY